MGITNHRLFFPITLTIGILLLIGAIFLGLYAGGVFESVGTHDIEVTISDDSILNKANAEAAAVAAAAATASVSAPSVVTATRSLGSLGSFEDENLLVNIDPGYSMIRVGDNILFNWSDRSVVYYNGEIQESRGIWWGRAGVHENKAFVGDRVVHESSSLRKPIYSDDEMSVFLAKRSIIVDIDGHTVVETSDKVVLDGYVSFRDMVVLLEGEVRTYSLDEGISLKSTRSVKGKVLAEINGSHYAVASPGRVMIYDPNPFEVLAPEESSSFGTSVAHYSGYLYVGAPDVRTVYVFAKVDDMWLPHGAIYRDVDGFGKSVEAGSSGIYIGSATQVWIYPL